MAGADDLIAGFRFLPGHFDRRAQVALVAALKAAIAESPFFSPAMPRTGKPFSVRQTLWLYCANGFSAVSASTRRCTAIDSAAQTSAAAKMKMMNLTISVPIRLSRDEHRYFQKQDNRPWPMIAMRHLYSSRREGLRRYARLCASLTTCAVNREKLSSVFRKTSLTLNVSRNMMAAVPTPRA